MSNRRAWLALSAALVAAALLLVWFSAAFAWSRDIINMPTLPFAAALAGTGLIYVAAWRLTGTTAARSRLDQQGLLGLTILAGLAMRLAMLQSTPVLEDDFYRYLWDGAVTANGFNPYAWSPEAARTGAVPPALATLARDGSLVLERVNHPNLKTVYPPIAQAAFAAAYWLEPWSLRAWRVVCLAGELATLALILWLLASVSRPLLWSALYWLNPLIVKELANAAHMEAVVMPFVLAGLALIVARRPAAAAAALALAAAAKVWPLVLLPFALRPLLAHPVRLFATLAMIAAIAAAAIAPVWLGGLDTSSGFVAYATYWQTNSALFDALNILATKVAPALSLDTLTPGRLARAFAAILMAVTSLALAWPRQLSPQALIARFTLATLAVFLLSPAQFPWYAAWVLPFAPFLPLAGFAVLTVLLPLYYVSFYLRAAGIGPTWAGGLVWLEWLPIWLTFLTDAIRKWCQPLTADIGQPRSEFRHRARIP